jgi:hypothetical protein
MQVHFSIVSVNPQREHEKKRLGRFFWFLAWI